jgi:glycosyltransferase involved in cell wall biosynthesis
VAERGNLEFLGRVEAFRDLVRGYDFALNPTWHESFGMAALEVLAAGVPLLSTRSGVIEQVIHDERYLTKPRDVAEMRDKLLALSAGWPVSALDVAACQTRIRERFLVERAARRLREAYRGLLELEQTGGLVNPN